MNATIFDIQHSSFVDGPGIRTTIFFKGCNLRCLWCHNPESQRFHPQLLFYKDKCVDCGKCLEKCPNNLKKCTLCGLCASYCPTEARQICGKSYTVEEVFREIEADYFFYETSGGGVTFSGGECMLHMDFLVEILRKCKERGIHTAIDTAGHVPYESFERIMPYTDMFLYDVKLLDPKKHERYVGVKNTLILENLSKLLERGVRIWIRIPIIAGINDSVEEIKGIRAFLEKYGMPEKVELLPYHKLGENKYRAIGIEPQIFEAPCKEKMEELRAIFPVA